MSPRTATKRAGAVAPARDKKTARDEGPVVLKPARQPRPGAAGVTDDERRIAKLRAIVEILESSSLAQLQYEDADIVVSLSRHGSTAAAGAVVASLPLASGQAAAPALPTGGVAAAVAAVRTEAPREEADVQVLRSPFIGTFYRSPSPDAEAFVDIGQPVRRGQTLCIVEAMKLMNEIESEVDGVVAECLAENGKPVQYGDALFKIRTKP